MSLMYTMCVDGSQFQRICSLLHWAKSHLHSVRLCPSHVSFTAWSSPCSMPPRLRGNSSLLGTNVTIPGHIAIPNTLREHLREVTLTCHPKHFGKSCTYTSIWLLDFYSIFISKIDFVVLCALLIA